MNNEEIYKFLEKQDQNIREILDARLKSFNAKMESNLNLVNYKLDDLIKYQEKQNNRIGKLENETRVFRLIHRNPKAAGIIIGLSVLGFVALFLLKNIIL